MYTAGSHICAEFVHSLIDTDFIQYSVCQVKLDTRLACTDKMHFVLNLFILLSELIPSELIPVVSVKM